MADYIPAIQEVFRRHAFPIERSGKIQQLTITSAGVQATEQERWEYRTKDEQWSVTVLQDSVVLQTTGAFRASTPVQFIRVNGHLFADRCKALSPFSPYPSEGYPYSYPLLPYFDCDDGEPL